MTKKQILMISSFIMVIFALDTQPSSANSAESLTSTINPNDTGSDFEGITTLSDDFIITVKTDNPGTSSDNQFYISITGGDYNYNVDCDNDGTFEIGGRTNDYTCNYASAGIYTIRIQDNSGFGTGFPRIYYANATDKDKLLTIEQWGTGLWTSMSGAFWGCSNLTVQAVDAPNLSIVTNMYSMFRSASSFNQNIGGWDTSNVTDMSYMFYGASAFNQDIGGWDTSNVSMVIQMFQNAISFDQDIGGWDVSSLNSAGYMFFGVKLSTPNYDALLMGWNAQSLLNGVWFNGGNSTYCIGIGARGNMIFGDDWTISDGGYDCTEPEIEVSGAGILISDGDTSPSTNDDTDFGSMNVGGAPITHTFTINNSGFTDLYLTSAPTITLESGTHFIVAQQPGSSTVVSGSSETFEITFNPHSSGIFTDTVSIQNNDSSENPYTFMITGKKDFPIFIPLIFN